MDDKKINVSVRKMVEFLLRFGNINSEYLSSPTMIEGVRLHQRIQKHRANEAANEGYSYKKECYLTWHMSLDDGFEFFLEGRADGVIRRNDGVQVEEIKSVLADLTGIQPNPLHLAQAKCYAYMICDDEGLDEIKVTLTYIHAETFDFISFDEELSIDALSEFFLPLVKRYMKWQSADYERRRNTLTSLKNLNFPYDSYRKGQREFAVSVYRTIKLGKNLFAQAPTGTGKTISTLFPGIKAIGEGLINKIFYMTAKTITRQVAQDAIQLMSEKGAEMISLTLTAKEKICMNSVCECTPMECEYARGHFDRINEAVWDILNIYAVREIRREEICEFSGRYMVCPYELSLELANWADIIICDYNYVFDPTVRLKGFFGPDAPTNVKYLFLVDESHNLLDRSRDMYSKTVYHDSFIKLRKFFKRKNKELSRICSTIVGCFEGISVILSKKGTISGTSPQTITAATKQKPSDLIDNLHILTDKMVLFLKKSQRINPSKTKDYTYVLEEYFSILDFLKISEFFSNAYTVFLERKDKQGISVKLLCLDASKILAEIIAKSVSTVFFSATLTPLQFFREVFGGDENDFIMKMPSPFDPANLLLIIENTVSTKYRDRSTSYDKIANCLHIMVTSKKGNYFAFFPSYDYLMKVYNVYCEAYSDAEPLLQNRLMGEVEREKFLQNFYVSRENSLLAFAVMGGIFSEGIDLKRDALIGAAIIGVGLPLINRERDIIRDYYDEYGRGYEYAYMYPGMNKILQSAGRVIRTSSDRGVIILIDSRFAAPNYLELFPQEWKQYYLSSKLTDLRTHLEGFWREN